MLELFNQFVMNGFLNKQSTAGAANMPLVKIDPIDNAFDCLIDSSIIKYNICRFTA